MIRTAAALRPARTGAALAGVASLLALAACAPATDTADPDRTVPPADAGTDGGSTGPVAAGSYADGTYTAEGTYATPESIETVRVTVTLQSDTITSVEVVGNPQKSESREYQGEFIGGIAAEVVGRHIDELSVHRVAGSSLTSGGFNSAIELIKQQATG